MGGIRTTFEFYVAPFDEYNKKRSDLECIGGVSVLLNTWGFQGQRLSSLCRYTVKRFGSWHLAVDLPSDFRW